MKIFLNGNSIPKLNLTQKPKFSKKSFALTKSQTRQHIIRQQIRDRKKNQKKLSRLATHMAPFPVHLKADEVCCKDCGMIVNRKSIQRHYELRHGAVRGQKRDWRELVTNKRPNLKTIIKLDSKQLQLELYNRIFEN